MSTNLSFPFNRGEILEKIGSEYDYLHRTLGWVKFDGGTNMDQKFVPYSSLEELNKVQGIGNKLYYHSMTAQVIIRNLINYIVGKGHTYTVRPRAGANVRNEDTMRFQRNVDDFCESAVWPIVQEDFYKRLFRTGESIQYLEPVDGMLDVSWIEPFHLKQQEEAPFGIKFKEVRDVPRASMPEEFYIGSVGENPKKETSVNIHFCKRGVDINDPRGIPMLWLAYGEAKEIDILHQALTQVMITVAENSVVWESDPGSATPKQVADIASALDEHNTARFENGHDNDAGRTSIPPAGTKVKNFGADVATDAWISAIASKERRIGVVANVPEFILTGDAETGNRSSLISAEGPMHRSIDREAHTGSLCEVHVIAKAIAAAEDKFTDVSWQREFKRNFHIEPHIPLPSTENEAQRSDRLLKEFVAGLLDAEGFCRGVNRNYESMMDGNERHQQRLMQSMSRVGPLAHDLPRLQAIAAIAAQAQAAGGDPMPYLEILGVDVDENRATLEEAGLRLAA